MGRSVRNPKLVLCSVKAEMLNLPRMDLLVAPAALSSVFLHTLICLAQALFQEAFFTPSLCFSLASSPFPPWQIFRLMDVVRSKQRILLSSCWSRSSEKLLRKILVSWPRGKKKPPKTTPKSKTQQQTTHKKSRDSFLWQILLCFSGRMNSTAVPWDTAASGRANGACCLSPPGKGWGCKPGWGSVVKCCQHQLSSPKNVSSLTQCFSRERV